MSSDSGKFGLQQILELELNERLVNANPLTSQSSNESPQKRRKITDDLSTDKSSINPNTTWDNGLNFNLIIDNRMTIQQNTDTTTSTISSGNDDEYRKKDVDPIIESRPEPKPIEKTVDLEKLSSGECMFVEYPVDTSDYASYLLLLNDAMHNNQNVLRSLKLLFEAKQRDSRVKLQIKNDDLLSEVLPSFIATFNFGCKNSIAIENGDEWPIAAIMFKQIILVHYYIFYEQDIELLKSDPYALVQNSIVRTLPHLPIAKYTQADTLESASELCCLLRVVPYTKSIGTLVRALFIRVGHLLSGYFSETVMNVTLENMREGDKMISTSTKYRAGLRYIYRMTAYYYFLKRAEVLFKVFDALLPDMLLTEFVKRTNLVETVRIAIFKRAEMRTASGQLAQFASKQRVESILGMADRIIAMREFPSVQNVNDILVKLYEGKGREVLKQQSNSSAFNARACLDGERLNLAELIAIKLFCNDITMLDNVPELFGAVVIENENIEENFVKIFSIEVPLLVQIDARFHLIWNGKRYPTLDIYETLAYFLGIICIHRKGELLSPLGSLKKTIKAFCNIKFDETNKL
jgi:hypothetical protein